MSSHDIFKNCVKESERWQVLCSVCALLILTAAYIAVWYGMIEEAPEIGVGALSELVHALLQRARGPVDGEVDILQQHPAALPPGFLQRIHRNGFLTL